MITKAIFSLLDLIQRTPAPIPWDEGDNIPWNEPGFSHRMLQEHLSQAHDAASRRFTRIDQQVDWICRFLLGKKPGRILDLGCGPGLYTERLARHGHTCVGIDYSPASINYARQVAQREALACTYLNQDLRQADFGTDFDLTMQIFGEFNVFCLEDACSILVKARHALEPDGRLLLEVHSFDTLYRMGHAPAVWYTAPQGLFADQPHLLLEESFWDADSQAVTKRYFLVDAATGSVRRYAASYQAYSVEGYRTLLAKTGFAVIDIHPALGEVATESSSEFIAITAQLC